MRIIIDEYNLQTYPEAFFVRDDKSFVEARQQILDFKIDEGENKTIVVTSHPYSAWFSDIENENHILVEWILPSKKLHEKFINVEIDRDLEEKDIVHLDLLNKTIEPTEVSIINTSIGTFLLNISDLREQLYEITAYAANPPNLFLTSKYLIKKWSKYLDKIECKTPVLQSLISKLKEADSYFCKVINQLIYVSKSQTLLRELIHDNRDYLEKTLQQPSHELALFLTESQFQISVNDQYEARIESFFKTLYDQDKTAFFDEKSDYKASLKAFLSVAKSITNEEKEIIFDKYRRNIDHVLEEKIRSLIKPDLSPPPDLKELSLSSQIEAWQKWAIETFIPFKFFLDEFPDDEDIKVVEEYANVYSDWLFNSYAAIIQNGIKTNYNIVSLICDELIDSRVVWLIIDGFPSAYTETLKSILKSNGINKIQENHFFAALPTITEIGIPTQLCGISPQSKAYKTNREEALKASFNSKKVVFKHRIKTFDEALESNFDVCCLHWQEIDEFMHKEDKDIETRRIDEINQLLNKRIKQIANVIKTNTDKKTKLIVSTDHGNTKCLALGHNIKNSSLLEACKGNPKERCVELGGKLSKVNLDENEIYYLKADQTLNTSDWVAVRGYRYFGRFDYGYRHGGLTPEETIVPFLICEIAHNEILPFKVVYGGLADLQLGYTETFKLQIRNDNDALVEICKIRITEDINFSIDSYYKIPALSTKTFDGKIKLPKSIVIKDGKANMTVSINYSLFGEKHNQEYIITVPIKRSGNESLDDLIK